MFGLITMLGSTWVFHDGATHWTLSVCRIAIVNCGLQKSGVNSSDGVERPGLRWPEEIPVLIKFRLAWDIISQVNMPVSDLRYTTVSRLSSVCLAGFMWWD
ncbi:hypothetical protein Hamer_G028719 [Homarus americanus]|uniref:Uncharacterized protein n=1 Tax=Homarus americanus TaxID=6706 RepID=A0A8J5JP06_HOMAM|nr:hypothetical protein Hamer_G028719 [Homarus americanus]